MAANLFLITVLLSILGSTTYILLKLLAAVSGEHLSQNWRYHGAVAISLLFVLPLHKLWAFIPVSHQPLPSIIAVRDNSGSVYLSSTVADELSPQPVSMCSSVDWLQIIDWAAVLWILIAAGLIFWNTWRLLCYRRLIEQASSEVNSHLQQIALEAACLVGVTGEVRLLASPLAKCPMLIGFFRPMILLPSEYPPDSDVRLILTHELIHFRRGDLWKKFLVNMIQYIHWFNPVIYLLNRDFAYWLETSCDEQVVRSFAHEQRKEYGYLLINYAPTSRYAEPKLCVFFTSCRYKLKRRISIMMKSNKKSRSLLGLVLALVLIVGCLATSALAASIDNSSEADSIQAFSFETLTASLMIKQSVEEPDAILAAEDVEEYTTTFDIATAIPMDLAAKARAMKTISWDIPSGAGAIATEACSMEAGQTININVAVSPASSSVHVGIVDSDGTFRYVLATNGSVNHDFSITTRGLYYVCVVNGSSNDISVVGFVNY